MLTEIGGKAGSLCEPAKQGQLRCPLLVRTASEDVVTGNLLVALNTINPRWWLPEFLNNSLGCTRFRQQYFRGLKIRPWQKQPSFPSAWLPWDEGQTEVDIELSWENPSTTIFIEMKYGSPVSATTTHNNGRSGHAADQLIRNLRVGLYKCGWYREALLFDMPRRDFAVVLLAPTIGNPLVGKYRDRDQLLRKIAAGSHIELLPPWPVIGEASYQQLLQVLIGNRRWMSRAERALTELLSNYLELKLSQFSGGKLQK